MYRILISGYYGFNNIGDESILKAVTTSLKEGLSNVEITVLSKDPAGTAEKFGVKSCDRKAIGSIIGAVAHSDMLVSGGGSLLQDVTSRKSILYYLFIMWLAHFMGKKVFVYSQGIGPINSSFNRRLTRRILRRCNGIVVRDEASAEFLVDLGIAADRIVVTADPVLRLPVADLGVGREILIREGYVDSATSGSTLVGLAVKERKLDSAFVSEMTDAAERLIREKNAKVVLIPFHYSEDLAVANTILEALKERGLGDRVCALQHKYLSGEMLSIIGNMDLLVGVRLHSLIHAAIMGVPMIGISYDPKINSFMHSIGQRAMCSVYDFKADYLLEEFDKLHANREEMLVCVKEHLEELKNSLYKNEALIQEIINE